MPFISTASPRARVIPVWPPNSLPRNSSSSVSEVNSRAVRKVLIDGAPSVQSTKGSRLGQSGRRRSCDRRRDAFKPQALALRIDVHAHAVLGQDPAFEHL